MFVFIVFIVVDRTFAMSYCFVMLYCKFLMFVYVVLVMEDDKKNSGEIVKVVFSMMVKVKVKVDKKKVEVEGVEGMDVDGVVVVKMDEKILKIIIEDVMDVEMIKDDVGEVKKEDEEGEKKDDKFESTSEELINSSRVTSA